MQFIQALFDNSILQTALIAAMFASIASGIIGSFVVVKRMVFISASISHSVLGGMGLFLFLEKTQGFTYLSPLHGALLAALLSAWAIGWIEKNYQQRQDSVIGALWSIGMAIGLIFIALTPGSKTELNNFLVGNLLWVQPSDLAILCILDLLIIFVVCLFYKKLLIVCFDQDQAKLQGVPVKALYSLLLVLTALCVVILIEVVGAILVITMLTLPPTIANLFCKNKLSIMIYLAIFLSISFSFSGIALSYYFDWPAGASIALFTGLFYLLSLKLSRGQS